MLGVSLGELWVGFGDMFGRPFWGLFEVLNSSPEDFQRLANNKKPAQKQYKHIETFYGVLKCYHGLSYQLNQYVSVMSIN